IGTIGNSASALRVANAKTHSYRHRDMFTNLSHPLGHLSRIEMARASHTFERHVIHIASSQLTHLGYSLSRRGWRQQENRINVYLSQIVSKVCNLFRRVIDHQNTIDARLSSRLNKGLLPHTLDGIGIPHKNHRSLCIVATKLDRKS